MPCVCYNKQKRQGPKPESLSMKQSSGSSERLGRTRRRISFRRHLHLNLRELPYQSNGYLYESKPKGMTFVQILNRPPLVACAMRTKGNGWGLARTARATRKVYQCCVV